MRQVSGTSALPAPRRFAWMLSPYALPLHALRILAKCALPLIIWFSLGRLVRWGLLLLAATVSHGSWYQARLVLVMFLFTLVVMTSLATTVGLLYVVREALLETRARRAGGEAKESLLNALNRTALVFAGIYTTWGFVAEDARDFMGIDIMRQPDRYVLDAGSGDDSGVAAGLINLDPKVSLATMMVAYGVKWYFGRRHEAGNGRFSGALATFGELAFAFYGINAVATAVGARSDWIGQRSAVEAWHDFMAGAESGIPGWQQVSEWLGEVWPYVIDALAVPLAWLTVGILVYGAYAEDTQTTIRGTRLEQAAVHLERTHDWTRRALAKLSAGWTGRWIPLLNSLRLTARGGAPLFGLFALCYVGLHIGGDFLGRAGRYLAASEEPYLWFATDVPVNYVTDLVVTLVTMCLIAATFDLAATRARTDGPMDGRTGGPSPVTAGTAEPDRPSPSR
ncbi:hypothetical protein DI270_002970 [Microbispora triticiradicis]|uniref:ABC transporter permease n=1 Tax=Microbispora triticiradicis TaxID=2200763 RepID=A0ABX9LR17_9ACTN|nr:hypothetical protein DI270_002970 [Microbispora triticiradicis]GLW22249.1 hypothetical protein Mame01_22920 [Microbispora amethystogenes]